MNRSIHLGKPVEAALMSENPGIQVLARCSVSTAHDGLVAFINSERARNTHPADILYATLLWFIQVHASTAAQIATEAEEGGIVRLICEAVEDRYQDHMDRVRAIVAAGGVDGCAG